ncbi:hypothetical protein FBY51_1719 [Zymomonas mobilis]|nr:hypothetical protein FBY53_1655 [Zymomonas mobilis]TQL14839.1 hypothetical protein FBY51_1719 [Zymomonas mobilis]
MCVLVLFKYSGDIDNLKPQKEANYARHRLSKAVTDH